MRATVNDGTRRQRRRDLRARSPSSNSAPVFSTDFPDRANTEGDTPSLDADATDADGDTLTYSATGLPTGISIAPATGVISGTLASRLGRPAQRHDDRE